MSSTTNGKAKVESVAKRITSLERRKSSNLREIRRLQMRVSNGELGRNAGATFSALDRRMDADRVICRRLAELDES